MNPQDVMFIEVQDQVSHGIRIYETILGRQLAGGQIENIQRGLLGSALLTAYQGFGDLSTVTPDLAPRTDFVVDILSGLGRSDNPKMQHIAQDLADEIAAMCIGDTGPYSKFINGETNVELSRAGRDWIPPRIFSFGGMSNDPILQAIAYTQILSAIMRDSLIHEQPRIIAIDQVYRMMMHPSLLDFLVLAVKTLRTKRKKVIVIDQDMAVFLANEKTRLLFNNCPNRVIFSQKQGMNAFEDQAFAHLNAVHRNIIASLPKYSFVLDIQPHALSYLFNRPAAVDDALFGGT